MVLLQADVLDLKANPNKAAKGTIIEAQLDKGRGPVATVLVQNGTLKIGDPIVAGIAYGRVRAMMNDRGENVKTAGPSCPVEVLGFNEVPSAGDIMNVAEVSKKVAEERRNRIKAEQLKNLSKVSLEDLFSHIAEGEVKTLNIVVKADVHGSVEAVKQALEKLSNEEVRREVHSRRRRRDHGVGCYVRFRFKCNRNRFQCPPRQRSTQSCGAGKGRCPHLPHHLSGD